MEFSVEKISGGVLYIDDELICIKSNGTSLLVYAFSPSFHEILRIEVSRRTNKVGRYKDGIYVFQELGTNFHSFTNGIERREEGKFYYKYESDYKAFTSLDNKGIITIQNGSQFEIPILQQGGRKLFWNKGLVQVEEDGKRGGTIVYNNGLNRGSETWKLNYSELTQVEGGNLQSQLFTNDGKLFFVLTGNSGNGLFVVDIETGELIKKFHQVCYEIFNDGDYIYSSQFENVLCRINTENLEIETWDCNSVIKENGFQFIHDHRCDVKNGMFYFTQTFGDNKAKLGVLDWEKRELIYKHDFEPENGGIGSICIGGSRMFVHTQDNTLHIFQRL